MYRTGGASGAASVVCSTANGTAAAPQNFAATHVTLHWADGDYSTKYCSVALNDSVPYSGFKTFYVELSSATGATLGPKTKTTVTIAGNKGAGAVTMSAASYSVAQNASHVMVTVKRTGGSATNALVFYSTANKTAVAGTDFTAVTGELQWAPNDAAAKTFTIPISNAKPFKGTKALSVQIYGPHEAVLGSIASATVTINGDATPTPTPTPSPPTTKGSSSGGFFVSGGKLYDANGTEFRIRGVDRCHFDSPSQPGISNSGANAVRMFMYQTSTGAAKYASVLQTQHIAYNEVPILAMPVFPDGSLTSGNMSTSELDAGVAWWVANAATFVPLSRYLIINIANEWGPINSTVWRDAYISEVSKLRAAGYHGTLMIDAGGWGQDFADLLNYSTAVFNSDPDTNIIFSLHIYGNIPTASVASDLAQLKALSSSVGMAFVIGEFGPGRNIGPSPTLTTPADIINAAEANGIGWIGWAWDDNNGGGGASSDTWFSMTFSGPGIYTQTSDLTTFGKDIVLNSTYGLKVLAKPATIF